MTTVISKDGTPIATLREGKGAPLILVHGTGGASARWVPLLPYFTPHFNVIVVDRRGRGKSGDTQPYSIHREFEDIAAVVDSLGEPAFLLGHSFGGLCSLEASLITQNIRKLVIYESPIRMTDEHIFAPEMFQRLEDLSAAGDWEGVVTVFMRDINKMPDHEFEIFRSSPAWKSRVAAAHTLTREMRAIGDYLFNKAHLSLITIPTLLMLGGESPDYFHAAINGLHDVLPNNRMVVLAGQQHIAMDTARDEWVREVIQFLQE